MSEMYPTPATRAVSPEAAKDLESQLQHVNEMDQLRETHDREAQAPEVVRNAAGSITPCSENGLDQADLMSGLFSSPLITIRRFTPSIPKAGEADWAAKYRETLATYADERDFVLRQAAVEADRIHEPAIWEAVLTADVIVAYELFYPDMFVVSGNNAWETLMRGDMKTPMAILPLCTNLEPGEFQDTVVQLRAARGKRTCKYCEEEIE